MLTGLTDGWKEEKPRTFSPELMKPSCPLLSPDPPGNKELDLRIFCALLPAELAAAVSGVDHLSRVSMGPRCGGIQGH